MRRVLLDTQIFLWAQFESKNLPREVREAMAADDFCWCVSQVSLWEIQIKYDLKKLPLPASPGALIPRLLRDSGLELAPLQNDAIFMLEKLPRLHRDPFDRLVMTTAMVNGWEIATSDPVMDGYPVRIFRGR